MRVSKSSVVDYVSRHADVATIIGNRIHVAKEFSLRSYDDDRMAVVPVCNKEFFLAPIEMGSQSDNVMILGFLQDKDGRY